LTSKSLGDCQRQYWNAFKHATHWHSGQERDDDKLLSRFTDEQNDTALFIGWYDYAQATKTMPVEAQAQQAWYIALHPAKLDPSHSHEPYEELFPGLRNKPRAEQKRMLNEGIERARADGSVMTDPRTDARALMLGWYANRASP
jgi:hypothetical protein